MKSSSFSAGDSQRSTAPASKSPLTVDLALNVLRKWWAIVIPVGLVLGATAGAVVVLTFSPKYEAKMLVRIAQNDSYLVEPSNVHTDFVNNQLGLIRSTLVLGPVISEQEIGSLPEVNEGRDKIDALRSLVNVYKAFGSEHFYISATSTNPAHARAIADAVSNSYFRLVETFESSRHKTLIDLLEAERENKRREVERLRENVQRMTIDQTGSDPYAAKGTEDSLSQLPLMNLQNQLTTIRVERTVLQAQIRALEEFLAQNKAGISDSIVERLVAEDEQVRQRRAQIEVNRVLADDAKAKAAAGEKAARHVSLRELVRTDTESLDKLLVELRTKAVERLTTEIAKRQQEQVTELKQRLAEFTTRETALSAAYDEELRKVKKFTGVTFDLDVRRAELELAEGVMNRIAQRSFLLKTEQRAPKRVERLMERAELPQHPVEDLPYKNLLIAFVAAFCCPYLLALAWDLRVRRVSSAEQLQQQSSVNVVGEIACLPVRSSRSQFGRARANRDARLFEESVESLRICLVMTESMRDAQVFAVCSATSQEGKTTLSAQLGISMARSTEGLTLLIDGDMRSPDLHSVFDIENKRGLADLLAKPCSLDEVILPTWDERLHLLPAGRCKGRPYELVRSRAFEALLETVRGKYRYIIIDTPPVLPAGEALVMACGADVTLLCTRRDVSRHEQVRRTYDRLVGAGAQVAGCVFNGIPGSRYEYRYGGYYYSQSQES